MPRIVPVTRILTQRFVPATCFFRSYAMGKHNANFRPGERKQESKPRLTHFLCLPLVNETSIPQLAASLEEFKSGIPLVSNPAASRAAIAGHSDQIPLVPDGAIRPLGTLHLTLGVMSLPTQERLDEALSFLQSLDIGSMIREATAEAAPAARETQAEPSVEPPSSDVASFSPLTVNLTSLHALPGPRAATILHARPIDPTSRLYPFCVKLRDRFIEAGFMHQDMVKTPKDKGRKDSRNETNSGRTSTPDDGKGSADSGDNLPAIRTVGTTTDDVPEVPRPLLLHATIANTIYLGKRCTAGKGSGDKRGGHNKKKKEVYKFDARELLSRFGEATPPVASQQRTLPKKAVPRNQSVGSEQEATVDECVEQKSGAKAPFTWAQDIPIDRLCICEMGAKPVEHGKSEGGPDLGEEYRVIGTRNLDFSLSRA